MQKYKTKQMDGYELRTLDLQATDGRLQRTGNWVAENSIEILMGALFIAMVYGVGMLMSTTAQAVDLMIEYADMEQVDAEDEYQTKLVLDALVEQRAKEATIHAVTGAELPPYWTVPEETY